MLLLIYGDSERGERERRCRRSHTRTHARTHTSNDFLFKFCQLTIIIHILSIYLVKHWGKRQVHLHNFKDQSKRLLKLFFSCFTLQNVFKYHTMSHIFMILTLRDDPMTHQLHLKLSPSASLQVAIVQDLWPLSYSLLHLSLSLSPLLSPSGTWRLF